MSNDPKFWMALSGPDLADIYTVVSRHIAITAGGALREWLQVGHAPGFPLPANFPQIVRLAISEELEKGEDRALAMRLAHLDERIVDAQKAPTGATG